MWACPVHLAVRLRAPACQTGSSSWLRLAELLQNGCDLKFASIIIELWLEESRYVRQASCGRTDPYLLSQKGQHLERFDDFELPVQLFKNL